MLYYYGMSMLPPKPGQPGPGGPPAPQGAPNGAPPSPGPQAQQPNQQQPEAPKPMSPKDSAIPLNTTTYTFQPEHANVRLSNGKPKRKLTDNDWTALSNDLSTSVSSAISARQTFEINLQDWRDAYDLIMPENDEPAYDGANIRLPYSATQLESLKAYIAGTVLVPRMYVVTGRTPAAVQVANEVERFYNSELTKMRADGSSYFQRYASMIHMALRDGTCVMEVLWNRTRKRTYIETEDPETDDQGNQKFDDQGSPVFKKTLTEVDVFPSDFAEVTPVSIQDFLLLPAESQTIESAAAVARCLWLYESDLIPMVRAGIMDAAEVERALSQAPSGTTEVAADRQGTADKNVSQQIDIGLGQGTVASRFFRNRGPLKVWRIHSKQYDMDMDGEAEENIFYLHEIGNRMLGWMNYDYPVWQRPFFSFTPFPRPDEFYGYSLMERLARVQSEMDINHNTRINLVLKKMNAPLVVKDGAKIDLKQGRWYMNEVLEAEFENGRPSMQIMDIPDINISTFQEEQLLHQYGDAYTSLNQPAVGANSSGKRSATELRQQNTASGTRMALICNELRITLSQGINFIHILNKTYMRTDPQFVDQTADGFKVSTLSLDKLSEDLEIGIAGATEPIDSTTRRNEIMAFVEKMMMFPFVQADMSRQWYLARLLSEAFGRVDTTQIIGTVDQAVQMQQAQQQAAAAQQQHAEQFVKETGHEPPHPPNQPKPHNQGGGSHPR